MSQFSKFRKALTKKVGGGGSYGESELTVKTHKMMLKFMDSSVKFNIPKVPDLMKTVGADYSENSPLFEENLSVGMNTPYRIMWVDMSHVVEGVGVRSSVLVYNITEKESCEDTLKLSFFPVTYVRGEMVPPLEPLVLEKVPGERVRIIKLEGSVFGDDGDRLGYFKAASYHVAVFNLLLKFLQCKNVEAVDEPVTRAQVKRARKNNLPLVTYKTLVVKPLNGKGPTTPVFGMDKNRVHTCMGHFKTFSEERPLFGKYSGTYWWNAIARGSKEKGIVIKDYEIS